jgi:hypothetical protein
MLSSIFVSAGYSRCMIHLRYVSVASIKHPLMNGVTV